MNPIQTIRMGILACAARALGACTQSANGPGARGDSRGAQSTTTMPDANTWRHAPGAGHPDAAGRGRRRGGRRPSTGANGAQGDRPLPGTPPLMQY